MVYSAHDDFDCITERTLTISKTFVLKNVDAFVELKKKNARR